MAHIDETTRYRHPSYGIISFNRIACGGGRRLFGSSLNEHFSSVRVRISHCERATDHGLDRFRSIDQIIEIELSAAQFAEAITSMNVGDGVPCTIQRLAGAGAIPEPPVVMNAADHAKSDFAARMKTFARSLVKTRQDVEDATEGKVITAALRKSIRDGVDKIAQEVGENIPYFITCYEEATEKIKAAAKAEADAWLTSALHRAGLQSLRSALARGGHEAELPALEAAPDEAQGEPRP